MNRRNIALAAGLVAIHACGPSPGSSMASGTADSETSATVPTGSVSVENTGTEEASATLGSSATSQGDSETTWGSPECPDVYEGDLEIGPEANIEEYRLTSRVKGSLLIGATMLENLDFLSCLERVDHGLVIRNNAALTSLSGLEQLESVGDPTVLESWLLVDGNPLLVDLDAVSSLRSAYLVQISGNASLVSLGLGGLESVELLALGSCDPQDDDVDKANNGSLSTINGLQALFAIGRGVEIASQKSLTNLGRLHELALAGAFMGPYDHGGEFLQNDMLPIEEIEALSTATGRTFFTCGNLNDVNTECTCPPPD